MKYEYYLFRCTNNNNINGIKKKNKTMDYIVKNRKKFILNWFLLAACQNRVNKTVENQPKTIKLLNCELKVLMKTAIIINLFTYIKSKHT